MTTNKFLNYIFGESHVTNGSSVRENYQRLIDRVFETSMDFLINDKTKEWKAICLSDEQYETSGVVVGASSREVSVDGENDKGNFFDVKMHRIGVDDRCMKNPFGPDIKDEKERNDWIFMHEYARSESSLESTPEFGSILMVREDVFGRLTFTPTGRKVEDLMLNPFKGEEKKFGNNSPTMEAFLSTRDKNEDVRDSFEKDLKALITAAGLPFTITSRTRDVEDQIRIMKGKSYAELKRLYGKETADAIRSGDDRKLTEIWEAKLNAGRGSNHLHGLALDLWTAPYTHANMTTVIRLIKQLGGGVYLEPRTSGCWNNIDSGSPTRNDDPGYKGSGSKCETEHIHIDIPANYVSVAEKKRMAAPTADASVSSASATIEAASTGGTPSSSPTAPSVPMMAPPM
jgi:hypothetical protein